MPYLVSGKGWADGVPGDLEWWTIARLIAPPCPSLAQQKKLENFGGVVIFLGR